jgi:hypothetical protein
VRSYGDNYSFKSDLAGPRDFNKWGNRMDPREQLDLELLEARMRSIEPAPRTPPAAAADPDDDRLLDARAVGLKLGLHADTVRKRFASGAIPGAFPLFGTGAWRITRANFRHFLDDSAQRRRRLNVDEIMKRGEQPCVTPPAPSSEDAAPSTSPTPTPIFRKGSRATRR